MTIGGTDLNLLLALNALLEERNVTRAGERLSMSQPAMSMTLAKLRRRFGDELLVRRGREFELTPLARDLLPRVQEAARLMDSAFRLGEPFDPATSDRTFVLTMSDHSLSVLHPLLQSLLVDQAPAVQLDFRPLRFGRPSEAGLRGTDLLVGPLGYDFGGECRPLWRDPLVCLMDARHPLTERTRLTLEDCGSAVYAVPAFGSATAPSPVDRVFAMHGVTRQVRISVSGWLPIPYVIEGTDLLAIVPSRLARRTLTPGGPLTVRELPLALHMAEAYWYDPARAADAGHRWLVNLMAQVEEQLRTSDDSLVPTP